MATRLSSAGRPADAAFALGSAVPVAGATDRPARVLLAARVVGDVVALGSAVGLAFALRFGKLLRIGDAGDKEIGRKHHGRGHDRTGQGPPARLVQARYPAVPRRAGAPLKGKGVELEAEQVFRSARPPILLPGTATRHMHLPRGKYKLQIPNSKQQRNSNACIGI